MAECRPYFASIFMHNNQWDSGEELDLNAAATPQELGAAVDTDKTRRVMEITIRHAGSANTVVTLGTDLGTGDEEIRLSIDVPAETTRVWSSSPGRTFDAGETPEIQTSDVTGGDTYVTASGVEA